MKNKNFISPIHFLLFVIFLLVNFNLFSQDITQPKPKSLFWSKVTFGGGLGLAFGNFTNVTIAPSAKYAFSEQFSVGTGLQYSYISSNNVYKSNIFGGSVFTLYNPVPEVQLSLDMEQLYVNTTYDFSIIPLPGTAQQLPESKFWTTALFVGAGYNLGGITVGGRYNVLFDKNKSAYSQAFMPYVRVFF